MFGSKPKPKVLLTEPIHERGTEILRKNFEVVVAESKNSREIEREIREADAVIVRSFAMTKEMIEKGRRLKVIARHGVGLDNVDVDYATSRGIAVVYTPTANINSVAEHTVTVVGLLAKRIMSYDREVRNNNYGSRDEFRSEELEGKTLGLVGIGRIGSLVAEKARKAFGMRIVAFDPYKPASHLHSLGVETAGGLDELLAASDFVSLHVPLTAETRNIIAARELGLMRPDAFLINCCRGGLVNEQDLLSALESGRIAGAYVDVFCEEPPSDHPFYALENVVLTPHTAGLTRQAVVRTAECVARGVADVLEGRRPEFLVNPEALV